MTRLITALAAAAVLATAANAAPTSVNPVAPRTQTGSAPKATAEKQYCINSTMTGSRLPQTTCRTRRAWMADGFDPTAKN